jgi:hypothetical protein
MDQDFRKAARAWNKRPFVAAWEMPSICDVSFKE